MAYEQITDGLTLTVPTSGTTGWAQQIKQLTWKPISSHDHTGGGKGVPLNSGALASESVTSAKLAKNIALTQAATLTPVGTTQTIDFNNGNKQTLDLSSATGAVTVSFSNAQAGASYRIKIIQGATATTVVWPVAVLWAGAVEPTQYQEASSKNVVYLDFDGTDYLTVWDNHLG
jgi:hypothetical protein